MNQEEWVNFVLQDDEAYTPVQIQKLFFILDKEIASRLGGPFFDFQPYDYGPFDKKLYEVLETLHGKGIVQIEQAFSSAKRSYKLTPEGMNSAKQINPTGNTRDVISYIQLVCKYVRDTSFAELVSSIYKHYPEMKKNSVFREL